MSSPAPMDWRKAGQRFALLFKAGTDAEEEKNYRNAADNYREAILESSREPWTPGRHLLFLRYFILLSDPEEFNGLKEMEEDYAAMKKIYKNESEPVLFRATALKVLGSFHVNKDDIEKTTHYLRMAHDLISTASEQERNMTVDSAVNDDELGKESVGVLLDQLKERCQVGIAFFETTPDGGIKGIPDNCEPSLLQRLVAGGGRCDCCGKKREDVDGGLFWCTRCKRAYYCSSECQHQRWKQGHKQACRKPDQIEPGDLMLIKGLVNRPELNLTLVKVVGTANGGRWEVRVDGRPNTLSLAPDKLHHIRPAK